MVGYTDLPIMQWLPVIKRIQAAGKGVVVDLQLAELEPFIGAMEPEGVFLCLAAAEAIAGETLLFQSDVLQPEMAVGVDVALPEGIKRLRLHVGDAGNGIECDHANWCNAGFVTK